MAKKKTNERNTSDNVIGRLTDLMMERFEPLIPEAERAAVRERLNRPLPPAIRLNPSKRAFGSITDLSERYGWETSPVAFCAEGYRLTRAPVAPGATAEHSAGAYYIQDSASMIPVSIADPAVFADRPLILDLAASPGGKTTHLVSASDDRGLILANDAGAGRIPALRKVLKNYGALNQVVTNFPGESVGSWFANQFDFILLDAPCSMQSLVSIDSHPMRPISEREETALAQRQSRLLAAALTALKPGGQLVYSTCTLSPLEDEAVVDGALKRFGSAIDVGEVRERLPFPAPGISAFDGKTLDPRTERSVRLWPNRYETAGFFATLFTKTAPFAPETTTDPPFRPFEKSGYRRLTGAEESEIAERLRDLFGYDAAADLSERDGSLLLRDHEIWALPNRALREFSGLPAKSIGMRVAFKHAYGWIADFDWTTYAWDKISAEKITLNPEEIRRWQGGQELIRSDLKRAKGSVLFLTNENGVPIGVGAVSGNRLRNIK